MTVAELEARCSVLEPGVVLLREVANGTAETYEVMTDRAIELGSQFGRFALVVDLEDVSVRPKAGYLEQIKRSMVVAEHLAVTQPRSAFLRIVAGFVIARMSSKTSSHDSIAAATVACRRALRAAEQSTEVR